MISPLASLTPNQLRQAADLKEQIARLQEQLESLLGAPAAAARKPKPGRKRWTMSAEARARIGAAQKKVWAARRKKQGGARG